MKISLSFLNGSKGKYVVLGVLLLSVIVIVLMHRSTQVNRPISAVGLVLPGSTCSVDQTSTQFQISEKPWEIGFDVFGGQYNSKNFYGGRVVFRYKF